MNNFKKQDKEEKIYSLIVFLMPLITILALVFAFVQMRRQETAILEVCADQQDSFVDLVLDQIGQQGDWENEEITANILFALDASDSQYWTFSSDQTVLFVKNQRETNIWKDFTTATYYSSDSAQSFIQQLRTNRITHATIVVEGEKYLASGVAFDHQGRTYQLCLLTNRDTVLDNNHYIGVKILYWILIISLLTLMRVISYLLAKELREVNQERKGLAQTCQSLNAHLTQFSEQFINLDLHDTRHNLWKSDAISVFAGKLQARGVSPVTLMRIHCHTLQDQQQFLNAAPYTLDRTVLRFEASRKDLILIFIGSNIETARLGIWPLLSQTVILQKAIEAGTQDGPTIQNAAQELENMQESTL
jgi:hypothetical protein